MAQIVNIFARITFNDIFELLLLSKTMENSVYNPRRFNGLVLRLINPKASFLVFRTGKVIGTGIRCETDLHNAVKKLFATLKNTYPSLVYPKIEITNYTASMDIGVHVKIDQFYKRYQKLCILEKELFPALKLQLTFPSLTVLIFHTGKIILTGTTNLKVIERSVSKVKFMLCDFLIDGRI